ncbi:MAG: GntR family transcriptional regulator [Lachnospiraceae bacterium]|jgi:DNA-binding GntR family transcriptional regulator|nr:GntR family transcriptional regulator [Lachnospiraceae bacterium]MDD3616765.1 GntR family transcriptional regulator [Lachnospiraceae bacterium]
MQIAERKDGENNREYAYRVLRKNIMTLQMTPGTPINEGEISEQLGISRTPVHEAVIQLKAELLVDVIPQSGSKISYIDINILKEGCFLRESVEPILIKEAAGKVLPEWMERLKENLMQQEQVMEEENAVDDFFKLDDKFHKLIYQLSGKPTIWEAVRRVCSHYDRVRYMDAIMQSGNLQNIYKEHQKLYHILLLGIPEGFMIDEYYKNHLTIYKKHFSEHVEEHPEYFIV